LRVSLALRIIGITIKAIIPDRKQAVADNPPRAFPTKLAHEAHFQERYRTFRFELLLRDGI